MNMRDFQAQVKRWTAICFGKTVSADVIERNHRFLEEALELVQSLGCTRDEAHDLVEYVYNRAVGEPLQELGGVLTTLCALANAHDFDVGDAGQIEIERCWRNFEKIRAKQAAKPKHSALPQ